MPVEIKELHIKINVSDGSNATTAKAASATDKKDKIIAACVEQLLNIQKRKEER